MAKHRIDMISEEVRKALDHIIRDCLDDPRIKGTFCITRTDVTRDLSYAKIYVSVLEEEFGKDLIAALKSAAGFIRRELGKTINIRHSPELSFILDKNIEYGIHIAEKLKQVLPQSEEAQEEEVNADNQE